MRRAERLRYRAGEEVALDLEVQESERRLQQRAVDALRAPRALTESQRVDDAEGAQDAGGQIEERHATADGRAARLARDRHDAGEGLHERLVAGAVGARPGTSERGDRAVDEPRVVGGQRAVAEPELLHGAGADVLDQHVRPLREALDDGDPLGRLEVHRDAALVAVVDDVTGRLAVLVRRPRARLVADGRVLDLHHVGAHVAEQRATIRTGKDAREVDDLDAIEGEGSGRGRHDRLIYPLRERRAFAASERLPSPSGTLLWW